VVGIGPGAPEHRTLAALTAISNSQVVVGYSSYMASITDLIGNRQTISTGMRKEIERVRAALEQAAAGNTVSLISSGDAGIYGMAGLAIELGAAEFPDVEIEIVPGVTAASAAAAALGAPLMLDFAVISLSDLLVPWDQIRIRLDGVAKAGLVTVLYNPRSKRRIKQLDEAVEIFGKYRSAQTPSAVVTNAGSKDEEACLSDLGHILELDITMRSIVIITSEAARIVNGRLVMPRGYAV
jgi:precorrin-3B C17-methyltransferase